jgi:hypothetical protein
VAETQVENPLSLWPKGPATEPKATTATRKCEGSHSSEREREKDLGREIERERDRESPLYEYKPYPSFQLT